MKTTLVASTLSDGGLPIPLAALDNTPFGRGEGGTTFYSLSSNFC